MDITSQKSLSAALREQAISFTNCADFIDEAVAKEATLSVDQQEQLEKALGAMQELMDEVVSFVRE